MVRVRGAVELYSLSRADFQALVGRATEVAQAMAEELDGFWEEATALATGRAEC